MRRALPIVTALALSVSPCPANAEPPPALPPFAPAYAPASVDERGIWLEADEHERVLRDSSAVIRDPALNAYVRGVLCRAVGEQRCKAARLYIVRIPMFNATMMPNGLVELWSGALLRFRNEAELAAVLGHEYGHFELRHGLGRLKRSRTMTDMLIWSSLLNPHNGALPPTLIGMYYAHQREQEAAADMMGLRFLKAAGYRATAAPQVWQRVMEEQDATAAGRKHRITHSSSAEFLATHPSELSRMLALEKASGPDGERGEDKAAAYARALAPWRGLFLADQIKLNDFGGSEYLIHQLAGTEWTADLLLARADLYRERGHPRDLVSAADFYREAIDRGCAQPTAWRGLGVALLRSGQVEAGRKALTTYLAKAPDAPDKAAMAMLIDGDP